MQSEIKKAENQKCAECEDRSPGYVSLNLGVFVCKQCAEFHKKLSIDRCHVVPTRSHAFTEEEIKYISTRGNKVVNENFEKFLPSYYHRPDPFDPPLIREQFIKAKYDREEFKDVTKQEAYNQGSKTGSLFKRGKDNDKFLHRKFVLSEPEGILEYFIKFRDRVPKDTVLVRNLVNVYLIPEKIGNPNGMQITYEKEGIRRNLYVFGNDGKSTIDWYNALRASMVKHKYKTFPTDQMKRYLNTKIIREGWMSKTGPKRQERFRKRWFSLVGTTIWYYAQPLDAHPINYIPLGSKSYGYGVKKGVPQGVKVEGYGLTIHTPERVYALACTEIELRDTWIASIRAVLDACTNAWITLEEDKKTDKKEEEKEPEVNNPSSFSTASTKYRPGSGSDESSEEKEIPVTATESEKDTATAQSGLFQKKTKATNAPQKYNKKSVAKRISSTKKITDQDYQHPDENDVIKETSESDQDDETDQSSDNSQSDESSKKNDNLTTTPEPTETKLTSKATPPAKPARLKAYSDVATTKVLETPSCESSTNRNQNNGSSDGFEQLQKESDTKTKNAPDLEKLSEPSTSEPNSETSKCANDLEEAKNLTFKPASKRVSAQQRLSVKESKTYSLSFSPGSGTNFDEIKDEKPRPVDVTVTNKTEEELWFFLFQAESTVNDEKSFITPWAGAKIAKTPASIGPIHIPDNFEIAVIDTAPGGFNLFRTTGPFYAQRGDVWEVEIPNEDEKSPELFFHEGVETENGSLMIYSNHSNSKQCEVAIFKSGRKLMSRKDVSPGDVVTIHLKPSLFFIQVDQKDYYKIQSEDIQATEWISKSTEIQLDYRHWKMKVLVEQQESGIKFSC